MIRLLRPAILALLTAAPELLIARHVPDTARKSVDLNEFVVRKSSVINTHETTRLRQTSLVIRPARPGCRNAWDSLLLLTRFPAPSPAPMVLHTVSSKLAALDTAKLDLFLVILQLRAADTLQYRIPVTPDMLDAATQRFEVDLRDSIITLQPSPFYLGFGFRIKHLAEQYDFPFYYTKGGDGAVLSFPQGRWAFISHPRSIYIFPFRITYKERGA